MNSFRNLTALGASLGLCALCVFAADDPKPPAPPSPQAVEFFETKVRPLLVENCISCHGPKKQQGGLRLDSREALLKGSDTGPILVGADPEKSSLIHAVRYTGDARMPPRGKMKPELIDDLTAWVKMGAPWPGDTATTKPGNDAAMTELRKKHWAFQPVRNPTPPQVKAAGGAKTTLDAFILGPLEAKNLTPAGPADKRTLLRRATIDLIGLPPTPEELAAFEADASPEAFAKVVDRLLASPNYGERWGRHWLDVARYADTKGYLFTEERRFPYSYTYRDYVVRSLNEDKPYDQFILEQLAADQLPLGDDKRPLAAMGFLTLGRRFLNNVHDIIDDRIDVSMRGLQGLSVACARCHDHKFDPISTKDYYSLYGVFASSVEPKDPPLIAMPEQTDAYRAYEKELQTREAALAEFLKAKHADLVARYRGQSADYLLAVRDAHRLPGEDHYEALSPGDLNPEMTKRWKAYFDKLKGGHHPILAPWLAFAALPQKEFAAKASELAKSLTAQADPKKPINQAVAQVFADKPPASLREAAQRYAQLFAAIEADALALPKGAAATLADPDREALREYLYGPELPAQIPIAEIDRYFDRAQADAKRNLQKRIDQFKAGSPAAPARAMVLNDTPTPHQPRVFMRGNPANLGDAVPRQNLLILAGDGRKPFAKGSGRLELAQAIASRDNPLTARVMVNRVWLQHFGAGLVRTPSDFGLRGELPTHPELLDYLAASFMENGWSLKKLHRQIMLSDVYQRSSQEDPKLAQADPENRWLGRMNRRRLEFEAPRDSLLAVSGRLDRNAGGPGVELMTTNRRTIYGFIDRQNLPGLFRTFDFASPDSSSPQRYTTTVPQQALFLMNNPFLIDQARGLIARPEIANQADPGARIDAIYRLLYGRAPDADERSLGLKFVGTEPEGDKAKVLPPWVKYAQVLLLANEFAFVD